MTAAKAPPMVEVCDTAISGVGPELEVAKRPTRMLVDQIRSIDIDYLVGDPVDYLSRDQIAEVELALVHYLGIASIAPPGAL